MAVMFGAMQIAKRIPFDDKPEYVRYAQLAYVLSQLLCLGVFYFCSLQVKKKNDLTVLKYVNAKVPTVRPSTHMQSQEPGELVTTTHRDYDLAEISKSIRGVVMGMAFMAVMHLYMGYTNPLVIQSIIPLKNALESNMAKIWIWGMPATGDLKRPFKPAPGLFSGMNQGPQTDKASVKEAEKITGSIQAKADFAPTPGVGRVMPVCVHCAHPVPALLAHFGSGHVALARCARCGRVADPYLEYGLAVLVIDLILIKPRVYRHILYNISVAMANTPTVYVHARRLLALVLVESYLTWFSLCVHPYAKTLWEDAHTSLPHWPSWAPAPLLGAIRVTGATLAHTLALHMTVMLAGGLVQYAWYRRRRSRAYWRLYSWHLPSVAMLYASLSTELLLVIRLVWDSRMPADRRAAAQRPSLFTPMHWAAPYVPAWLAAGPWHTEWLIRHVLGGMSAGVALAATMPMQPLVGALVALLGFGVQAQVRAWLGVPDEPVSPVSLCVP
ncbi:phosphate transporter (Pho88) [Malassezia caprae]|uniref:Protein ARV n=1 Tax=Malassezia caprae TaxID=1381934 RepID=A0AAF0IVQ1_9BASI|nr:phosphate transporter (Pho88) [Malassezia caprae]